MAFKLFVEDYGKIEKAEIEIAPLTLFVGDNNSGKSYLLSLIWAVFSGTQKHIIFSNLSDFLKTNYARLYEELLEIVKDNRINRDNNVTISESTIMEIINAMLALNKEKLVQSIFNYDRMTIGKIEIVSTKNRVFTISNNDGQYKDLCWLDIAVDNEEKKGGIGYVRSKNNDPQFHVEVLKHIIDMLFDTSLTRERTVYLPAARTGFMLARNTINQVSRKKAFNIVMDSERGMSDVSPFPKPIIHFLDVIDDLEVQREEYKYPELVEWVITNMSKGDVQCSKENNSSIQYVPNGMDKGIPLRATSGVVTELTPLLMLLKYAGTMRQICYEEPEMCLHPKLQLQMGRLLVRMVNENLNVIASTHSDIIMQHVNNMCQLEAFPDDAQQLEELRLDKMDLISVEKIAVYQFNDKGNATTVERIQPRGNAFEVPSFIKALNDILNQTNNIYNIVNDEVE